MGLLGSLVSGIFGIGSTVATNKANKRATDATNAANMQIAQMNNEWSAEQAAIERQWQENQIAKQNQWNLDQWNRENEYNSASSQRQRLEDAGLNPYNMMSGGNAGVAGSITSGQVSGVNPPSAQPVHQVAPQYNYDFSSVADAINSYYANKNIASDIRGKGLQNDIVEQFGQDEAKARIASLIDGRYEFLNKNYRSGREAAAPDLLGAGIMKQLKEIDAIDSTVEMNYANAIATRLQGQAQSVLNKYLDNQQQADLSVKSASVYKLYTEGKLNEATASLRIKEQLLTAAKAHGQTISNRIAGKTASAVMDALNEENRYKQRYYNELRKYARALASNDANISNIENDLRELESTLNHRYGDYERILKLFGGVADPIIKGATAKGVLKRLDGAKTVAKSRSGYLGPLKHR